MSHDQIVNSLNCTNCGAPITMGDLQCEHCGVKLTFNYEKLFGIQGYTPRGRDAVIDATLIAQVKQEALKQGVEVKPAVRGEQITLYVRHVTTGELLNGGVISYMTAHKVTEFWSGDNHWYILPKAFIDGGRMYLLGPHYMYDFSRSAEGEGALANLPEIQRWVKDCVGMAFYQPTPPAAEPKWPPIWGKFNPFKWLSFQ